MEESPTELLLSRSAENQAKQFAPLPFKESDHWFGSLQKQSLNKWKKKEVVYIGSWLKFKSEPSQGFCWVALEKSHYVVLSF